jgi:hypothetical protein
MSPATGPVRRNSAVPAVWKRKLVVREKRKGRIDDRGEIRVLVERFEADSLKRERA